MPPTSPRNASYSSRDDDAHGAMHSWDGSFVYNNGDIDYTRDNPFRQFPTTVNTAQGNAIVFSLTDENNNTARFSLTNYTSSGGFDHYRGHCSGGRSPFDDDGWTATSTTTSGGKRAQKKAKKAKKAAKPKKAAKKPGKKKAKKSSRAPKKAKKGRKASGKKGKRATRRKKR